MKILVSGGTGFIGKSLVEKLRALDHQVNVLQREQESEQFFWNANKGFIDPTVFRGVEAIVHLAGAPITKPWTSNYKKLIYDSRIKTADLLFAYAQQYAPELKTFVSASGISIYGNQITNRRLQEEDKAGTDFLSEITVNWEKAADQFSSLKARVVKIRTPLVLSNRGGSFPKMSFPFRLGLGTNLGNGNNFIPWVHLDDLTAIYVAALFNDRYHGAINAVADEQVTQAEINKLLAETLDKPFFLPNIPKWMVEKFLGERSSLVLNSVLANNMKLKKLGYEFEYSKLQHALNQIVEK